MKCKECPCFKYENDGFCTAELWKEYPLECYLRMLIQELRLINLDDEESWLS